MESKLKILLDYDEINLNIFINEIKICVGDYLL